MEILRGFVKENTSDPSQLVMASKYFGFLCDDNDVTYDESLVVDRDAIDSVLAWAEKILHAPIPITGTPAIATRQSEPANLFSSPVFKLWRDDLYDFSPEVSFARLQLSQASSVGSVGEPEADEPQLQLSRSLSFANLSPVPEDSQSSRVQVRTPPTPLRSALHSVVLDSQSSSSDGDDDGDRDDDDEYSGSLSAREVNCLRKSYESVFPTRRSRTAESMLRWKSFLEYAEGSGLRRRGQVREGMARRLFALWLESL